MTADGRRVGYLSKEVDWESFPNDEHRHGALSDLSARKYQPSKGAFVTQDQLWMLGSQYGAAHYSYHDPVNYSDPSGYNPDGPLNHPLEPQKPAKPSSFPKKDKTAVDTKNLRPHRGIPGGSQYTPPVVPSSVNTNPPSLPTDPSDPQYNRPPSHTPTQYEPARTGDQPDYGTPADYILDGTSIVLGIGALVLLGTGPVALTFGLIFALTMIASGTTKITMRLAGKSGDADKLPSTYTGLMIVPLSTQVFDLTPDEANLLTATIDLTAGGYGLLKAIRKPLVLHPDILFAKEGKKELVGQGLDLFSFGLDGFAFINALETVKGNQKVAPNVDKGVPGLTAPRLLNPAESPY